MFTILFAISQSISANEMGLHPTSPPYDILPKEMNSYFSTYNDIGLIFNIGKNAGHTVSMNWTCSAGKQFSHFYIGGGFSIYSYTQSDELKEYFFDYLNYTQSYYQYHHIFWRHTALDLFADFKWNIHTINLPKGALSPTVGIKMGCGIGSISEEGKVYELLLFVCRPSIGINYCINSHFQHEVGINLEYIPFNNFSLHGIVLNFQYKYNLPKKEMSYDEKKHKRRNSW